MSVASAKELMLRGLKTALMLEDHDPELEKLLKKISVLQHEYRDGHLYVGSEYPPKWEIRRSVNDTVYCKCPAFGFFDRPGKGTGLCKHCLYALSMDLQIPETKDLKNKENLKIGS